MSAPSLLADVAAVSRASRSGSPAPDHPGRVAHYWKNPGESGLPTEIK